MAVIHAPAGFTGTVDQIQEARRFAMGGGGRFRVASSADWAITANSGATRTVNIAAGAGEACGVYDSTTAADTVTFAANTGGTDRFDAVVASFDWTAMTVTFRVVQGTSVLPVVVRTGSTVDTTKINWLPGLRYDAVLGVIRARPGVTTLAPADLYDSRPYGAWSALTAATLTQSGTVIDLDVGQRVRDFSNGNIWEWTGTALRLCPLLVNTVDPIAQSGFTTPGVAGQGIIGPIGPGSAHSPGMLRVHAFGAWSAGATSAGYVWIGVSPTTSSSTIVQVPGSSTRIHNWNVANTPMNWACDGYIPTDGTAKYLWLLGSTDASSASGFQILHGTMWAWLL